MTTPSDNENSVVVHNDGTRLFSQLQDVERITIKHFYMSNPHLTLRAVGRLNDIKYATLYHTASKEDWANERKKIIATQESSSMGEYNYRARKREMVIGGIYDVLDKLISVYQERAMFSAQEGYADHFNLEAFKEVVELAKSIDPYFKKPEDLTQAVDKPNMDIHNTMMNMNINMDSGEKMKLAAFAESLMNGLIVPAWPEPKNGEQAPVLDTSVTIDPAKGETR